MLTNHLSMFIVMMHSCFSRGVGLFKNPLSLHTDEPDVMLMPRSEWSNGTCYTGIYKHVIYRQGCLPRKIKYRYCFGQCNSVYVPQMDSKGLRSCSACVPVKWHTKTIKLKCQTNNSWLNQVPLNVTIVKRCDCKQVLCDT